MFEQLQNTINFVLQKEISSERRLILDDISYQLQSFYIENKELAINFICTHNSRRSVFAQIWAHTALLYYNLPQIICYSGGTIVTEIYSTVLQVIKEQGFRIQSFQSNQQKHFFIHTDHFSSGVKAFSKRYDHHLNPRSGFIAISTCSSVDRACPIITGALLRFSLPYIDPKISDGLENEHQVYYNKSLEIASEMFYVFNKLSIN